MNRKVACVVSAFLLITAPSLGLAQSNAEDRIANLERVTAQLIQRVAALEVQLGQTPKKESIGSTGNPENVQNWRQLRRDMGEGDVERLLGSPTKVEANSVFVTWYYGDSNQGRVRFDASSGLVEGWEEPE